MLLSVVKNALLWVLDSLGRPGRVDSMSLCLDDLLVRPGGGKKTIWHCVLNF